MTNPLDEFLAKTQAEADQTALERFGPNVFERWKEPRFAGRLDRPTGTGAMRGGCGDAMVIDLRVDNGRISEAGFWTDGCGASEACGSACCELARFAPLDEAASIDEGAVLALLGGLPPENRHCARLASEALALAVDDCLRRVQGLAQAR